MATNNVPRISRDDWIQRFNVIYGDKFLYPDIKFGKASEKIKVICNRNHEFETTPSKHMFGRGCTKCNKEDDYNLRWENVKKEILEVHGDKYIIPEYSKIAFVTMWSTIPLICKIHGEFNSIISNCIDGSGCPKCNPRKKKDTKWFIEEVKKIKFKFDIIYDYSKTQFTGAHNKLIITCTNCNKDFEQYPHNHLNGSGCNNCSNILKRKSDEQFKKDFEKIHGNGYILSEYTTSMEKINIICPHNHKFSIKPNDLLQGIGCLKCYQIENESKGIKIIKSFLLLNNIQFEQEYTFIDCTNPLTGKLLRFDIFITDLNLCIEFDGQQHFNAVPLFGGKEELEKTIFRDNIKNEYCRSNNINLIRIKYNENIENILNERLNVNEHTKYQNRKEDGI